MKIERRLGVPPTARGSYSAQNCPDIFELGDGRFAVIGTDMTVDIKPHLPPDAGCADYERIVVITRETLLYAKNDIPDV
ncbi:hypothetical protein GR925_31435 [Streptomyces sp. HUCO-GS316]|uniref:hypothetical protein n=1 Tax=Streptomyces sp. HUCO-GS316 TaxID=2692198 RepID=UPI00137080C9|nr:hypothetical protein [Streptomyces sp. HUCO-GS316]MXM67826.1 hypothetical protein [Streptomyces sp. HUCO-GS316]